MKINLTIFFTILILLLTISKSAFAQSELQEKINKIEGKVDKITITADGKDYSFEGSDAEKLFKKIKSSNSQNFVWNSTDDKTKKKIIILNGDNDEDAIEVESGDDDVFIIKSDKDLADMNDGISKNVKVEIDNGEKKVTVTTKENGEEKTEVFEGDEADEYIKKMKSENEDFDIQLNSDKSDKKVKKIIIETEKDAN